jgi:hypothetical protein
VINNNKEDVGVVRRVICHLLSLRVGERRATKSLSMKLRHRVRASPGACKIFLFLSNHNLTNCVTLCIHTRNNKLCTQAFFKENINAISVEVNLPEFTNTSGEFWRLCISIALLILFLRRCEH